MTDQWEDAAKQYKPTGKAQPESGAEDWKLWQPPSLTPGTANSEPTGRFAENFLHAINPVPGISQMVSEATDPQIGLRSTLGRHFIDPQAEQFKKAGDAIHARGEFEGMGLPGRLSSAAGYSAAGALPLVGPAAAAAGEQIGSGDVAGGLGSGAGLIANVAGEPPLIRSAGRGLMRAAEPIAESAMGIRATDRAPAKTPGRAMLDMTTGVRPSTVSNSAADAIKNRASVRDAIIKFSPAQADLAPAINEADNSIARARSGNSETGHLEPMKEQLTSPRAGFGGRVDPATGNIANLQDAADFLPIRQRFGEDFTKFDVARPLSDEARKVGNRVYGKLTNELHRAVPESAPIDREISNLIPARDAAAAKDMQAGPLQRIAGRVAAHTGALAGGLYGASQFGLPGAIAGVAIPELLADPTSQMIAARGLNATGAGIKSPTGTRMIQAAPMVKQQPAKQ